MPDPTATAARWCAACKGTGENRGSRCGVCNGTGSVPDTAALPAPHDADPAGGAQPGKPAEPALTFTVFGVPKPKGSLRHVGHGRMVEQVNGVTWHDSIVGAVITAMRSTDPITGPLHVTATFTVTKPASAPKRRRTWPVTRSSGDLDKQLRRLFDAMGDAAVFVDDAQIVSVAAVKTYPHEHVAALPRPGVVVHVHRIADRSIG